MAAAAKPAKPAYELSGWERFKKDVVRDKWLYLLILPGMLFMLIFRYIPTSAFKTLGRLMLTMATPSSFIVTNKFLNFSIVLSIILDFLEYFILFFPYWQDRKQDFSKSF